MLLTLFINYDIMYIVKKVLNFDFIIKTTSYITEQLKSKFDAIMNKLKGVRLI